LDSFNLIFHLFDHFSIMFKCSGIWSKAIIESS
jgi:hypothetical protein